MIIKILSTTDGKYVGEKLEIETPFEPNEKLTYKGTEFTVEKITQNGEYITLYCPNYIAVIKVLDYGN